MPSRVKHFVGRVCETPRRLTQTPLPMRREADSPLCGAPRKGARASALVLGSYGLIDR